MIFPRRPLPFTAILVLCHQIAWMGFVIPSLPAVPFPSSSSLPKWGTHQYEPFGKLQSSERVRILIVS
jgi:hypothetical protein